MGLGSMLRIYCIQNWFSLSRRQMEDAPYEIESMRPLPVSVASPTLFLTRPILNFRQLLEKHNLTEVLLDEINARVKDEGLLVSQRRHGECHII
jgi:IS5 family transposase